MSEGEKKSSNIICIKNPQKTKPKNHASQSTFPNEASALQCACSMQCNYRISEFKGKKAAELRAASRGNCQELLGSEYEVWCFRRRQMLELGGEC